MESLRKALRRFIDGVPHARIFEDTGSPWHHKKPESTDKSLLPILILSKLLSQNGHEDSLRYFIMSFKTHKF